MTDPLQDQLDAVRQARVKANQLAEHLELVRQAFDVLHAPLVHAIEHARVQTREAERILRTLALVAYAETGSKQLLPGVSIREQVRLDYDPATAFQWAVDSNQVLVITPPGLNVQAFEKLARLFPLDFVTIHKVPQVLLGKEL